MRVSPALPPSHSRVGTLSKFAAGVQKLLPASQQEVAVAGRDEEGSAGEESEEHPDALGAAVVVRPAARSVDGAWLPRG